jgi:hypothetical protein
MDGAGQAYRANWPADTFLMAIGYCQFRSTIFTITQAKHHRYERPFHSGLSHLTVAVNIHRTGIIADLQGLLDALMHATDHCARVQQICLKHSCMQQLHDDQEGV